MKKQITEQDNLQDNLQEEWYKKAKEIKLEDLPAFLKELTEDYGHDYGTICHAIAAGAIATMAAMDQTPTGGITGFQAGCIMWEVIRHWQYTNNKTGLRMINYDDMLFPQYGDKFDKIIFPDVWEALQKEAKKRIEKADLEYIEYLARLEKYEVEIKAFIEKYPDYSVNPEKYKRLSYGNSVQWEEYNKKVADGFEFAPSKPYDPSPSDSVLNHWKSIASGKIPFGYAVKEY